MLFFAVLSLFFICGSNILHAQNKKRASLEVILSDNSPLQISINGRLYKPINKKLVIGDIPARNNHVEIIKKCNRSSDRNCKDIIIFSGKVRFQRGVHYQAVALVGEGQLRVSDKRDLIGNNTNPAVVSNQPTTTTATTEFQHLAEIKDNLPADINALGARMKKLEKDEQRVNAASAFVKSRSNKVSTDELLAITSWIMYDEHKLQFLKNAYNSVKNPENYGSLQMAFTMNDYKDQFQSFLQSK